MNNDLHERFEFGPFSLDTNAHVLAREGKDVPLPPKCFELLCLLVRENGRLLGKEHLMEVLWPNVFVEEANLPNLVGALRRHLHDSPHGSTYIQTVPKLGYRFVAPTRSVTGRAQEWPAVRDAARGKAVRIIAFPFRTSPDLGDSEYLAYSLPEAIASTLAELDAFIVRSTQMAMRFDPAHWNPADIAQQLEVDVILSGTISRSDQALRVVTHLLEASSGTVLWSREWDVERHELFRFQRAVVQLLVRQLTASAGDERRIGTLDISRDAEAYELYLRANRLTTNRAPENISLARDLYVACTERDPAYAPAWARLGRCYRLLEKFNTEPDRNFARAQVALERAFALNPDLAAAHAAYTPIESDAGNAEAAMVRLVGQSTRRKNNAEIFSALVHACRYCGLMDVSLQAHERAIRLDPNIRTSVAHTHFALGDFERALYWYGSAWGLYLDVLALASMGRREEAGALLWSRREQYFRMPCLMHALDAWLMGERDRGLAALCIPLSSELRDPEVRFYMARQAAAFDDPVLANRLLLRSCEEGFYNSAGMERDPWFESIRATGHYQRTLEMVTMREKQARAAFMAAGGDRVLPA
ncbi:MAG: winged helix-turn-helix domain-containing protein [Acidobacteriaceae bacterium]